MIVARIPYDCNKAESAVFSGVHEMSPFNFDSFSCTLLSAEADSIRVGIKIQAKEANAGGDQVNNYRYVYVNCRTRLVNSIGTTESTRSVNELKPDEEDVDLVRAQRYTKKYKSSTYIPKLPMGYLTQSQITNEQKVKLLYDTSSYKPYLFLKIFFSLIY